MKTKRISPRSTTALLSCLLLATFSGMPTRRVCAQTSESFSYRYFTVEQSGNKVTKLAAVPESEKLPWATGVSQDKYNWFTKKRGKSGAIFQRPIPFVLAPEAGSNHPFYTHNHQPSIYWLDNGDLLAIWFSTEKESGTEMTVLASRLRAGNNEWDPSSEFFKSDERNMTGSSLFNDGKGTLYHFNGMGPKGGRGWDNLALLLRTSQDNGETWTVPVAIGPEIKGRHQVISGTLKTSRGAIIQACDADPSSSGGTAIHVSNDAGKSWMDAGVGKPKPVFADGQKGEGTIAGIHGGLVELKDGKLMAFGRSDNINGKMPMSLSEDLGKTWTYSASPFPPIHSGQRLVLTRLNEGPIMFISFTHHPDKEGGMTFKDENGQEFTGKGMYVSLSYDEGKTWPVRKLLTPGSGNYDGGAWTRDFHATSTQAEPKGYLAVTQSPDNMINLISSALYYKFNLKWIETPAKPIN